MSTEVEFLQYLTPEDRNHILRNTEITRAKKGERILEEGSRRQTLGIVLDGSVSVERNYLGSRISVASIGAGGVFSEMSFLDGAPASASIYAENDDTQIAMLEPRRLNSLLQSVPGLSARFYQSLSVLLSERLRATTEQIPPLIIEEVASASLTAKSHQLGNGQNAMPPSIMEEVERFKTSMAEASYMLTKGKQSPEAVQPSVSAACQRMLEGLQDHIQREIGLSDAIGSYVFRETFAFFMASRFLDRSFTKPRGYAGDFGTIDIIYNHQPEGDGRLGILIDTWAHCIPAAIAVRNRRGTIFNYIELKLSAWDQAEPMPITSLACGPAREVFDLFDKHPEANVTAYCVDIDPEALNVVAQASTARKLEHKIKLMQGNIIRMALGKSKVALPPQALMYSIGLMDYLEDKTVIAILNWMHDTLMPGGEAIIGNFHATNPNKAFMDYVTEWVLIHRTPEQMAQLFRSSKFADAEVTVDVDASGVQLFARCIKR